MNPTSWPNFILPMKQWVRVRLVASLCLLLGSWLVWSRWNGEEVAQPSLGLQQGMEYPVTRGEQDFVHKESFPMSLGSHQRTGPKNPQSYGELCDRDIELTHIDPGGRHDSPVFLLETSGRDTLSPRQACTIESSATRSGRPVAVVMTSAYLNLRDNVTCYLFTSVPHLKIYTVDYHSLSVGTPVEEFLARDAPGVRDSLVPAVHLSDVLRLLLLFRYGGFYHDLDYVILGDLTQYKNTVFEEKGSFPGELKVTNSALGFPAGHPFLQRALERLPASYRANCWDCLGPGLLTAQLIAQYNTTRIADIPRDADVKVMPRERIVPVHGDVIKSVLWPSRPTELSSWAELFSRSSAVHMFSSGTNMMAVPRDPQYSAYALLGQHYCPLAYHGAPDF